MTNTIRLEAHRGVGTDAPENTMPAFEAAVKQGYDMIELDLKFTADGRCVVLHDSTVGRTGRTADGQPAENRRIADMTYAEACALDFGLWKGESFRGTKIPLFSEALALAKTAGIPLKIDNCYEHFTPEQRESLYRDIEQTDAGAFVGFTCANAASFAEVSERFPKAEFHYDGVMGTSNFRDVLDRTRGHRTTVWIPYPNEMTSWVSSQIRRASEEYVKELHGYGFEVGVWLLRRPEELTFARDLCRADLLETDGTLKPE
ncbi:MAG: glycerophosphodiester phosphodiesterase [Eubacteriales bacterium]